MVIDTTAALAASAPVFSFYDYLTDENGAMTTMLDANDGGSQLQRWSSLIGIITAIFGNILISFALNIQRYAHIRLLKERDERKRQSRLSLRSLTNGYGTISTEAGAPRRKASKNIDEESGPLTSHETADSSAVDSSDIPDFPEKSYLKSGYWWAGIVLMAIGETGNFLAYGFAPASIVSPLGVVALISNCVIAPILLKEKFRWQDFWGVAVAVAGAVTVVLSARQQEKKLGPHEVIGAITTTAFEIYMGVTCFMILVLIWASPNYGSKTIMIDLGLVGLFGGYTALSTKGVASMLSATLWKAFATPITYALIAVLVFTAIMQVKYLNKALQRFDSTQVIPIQFVMFTLSVIIGSAVLYRDFEHATVESVSKFVGGCLLTFFGVFLITSGRASLEDDSSDFESDEEDGEYSMIRHDSEADDIRDYDSGTVIRHRPAENIEYEEHDSPSRSRRSSHVSFISDLNDRRPQPPRVQSAVSQTPSVRLIHPDDSPSPFTNAWRDTSNGESLVTARLHPGLMPTLSAPLLPSEVHSNLEPSNPSLTISRSNSQGNPHSHLSQQHGGPSQAEIAQRPETPRQNVGRSMLPGLYISPLSSSLSAVVADTLRRGAEKRNSHRRPRLSLSRTKSGTDYTASEDNLLGSSPTKSSALSSSVNKAFGYWMGRDSEAYDPHSEGRGKARSKSFTNTFGNLLGGKLQARNSRADNDNEENEAEDGPSDQV